MDYARIPPNVPEGGLYAGGPATVVPFDLFAGAGVSPPRPAQPALILGASPFPSGSGTFFTSYSGLSDGICNGVIFIDGFELGGTQAWSQTSGP